METKTIAILDASNIYSDVLERIDGYEIMSNTDVDNPQEDYDVKIFLTDKLFGILTDDDDDTNDTTKFRIGQLYDSIKDYDLFQLNFI